MNPDKQQLAVADRAIAQTAEAIAERVRALVRKADTLDIPSVYVVEGLLVKSLRQHPEFLDKLEQIGGEKSMALATVLRDWSDLWQDR
jgi:hypothetical protein